MASITMINGKRLAAVLTVINTDTGNTVITKNFDDVDFAKKSARAVINTESGRLGCILDYFWK